MTGIHRAALLTRADPWPRSPGCCPGPRPINACHRSSVPSRSPNLLDHPELNDRHRVWFTTAYAAGLRVSELCHLRIDDILSDRVQIRVRQGKGNKERFTLLSARLLAELRRH